MTTFTATTTITASMDQVWGAVADLGSIENFHPGVSRSYYTSASKEGVGASRVCELLPMGEVEEVVTDWRDGESLTLRLDPIKGTPPFRDAFGRLELAESKDGEVEVTMTFTYGLRFGILGSLMNRVMVEPRFRTMLPAVLAGLKRHVETGEVHRAADRMWVSAHAA